MTNPFDYVPIRFSYANITHDYESMWYSKTRSLRNMKISFSKLETMVIRSKPQ